MLEAFWKRCSTCKREIRFGAPHWLCSVSTCSRKGNAFVFCSMSCWNAHVPTMRHREAWAEEQRAPSREAWTAQRESQTPSPDAAPQAPRAAASAGASTPAPSAPSAGGSEALASGVAHEILIVSSKLKNYIRARSGMNTSDSVMDVLSDRVRALCDDAVRRARDEGRKTVLDRDF